MKEKRNPMAQSKERKEILRLLKLLKECSKKRGRPSPKRDCYIETYIRKYKSNDLDFSMESFIHCDDFNNTDEEKKEAVPSYVSNTFRKFVRDYFEKEGKNERYRLLVQDGYRLELVEHTHSKSAIGKDATYQDSNKPDNENQSAGLRTINWIRSLQQTISINVLFISIYNIFIDGFIRPIRLVDRAKRIPYPRLDALLLFVGALIYCIERVRGAINDLSMSPSVQLHPELLEKLKFHDESFAKMISLPTILLAIIALLFLPVLLIWFYSFLRGDQMKDCLKAPLSPTTYAQSLSFILFNATFFLIVWAILFSMRSELLVSLELNIAGFLMWGALYLFLFYMIFTYSRAYNLLFRLPKASDRLFTGFILTFAISLEFFPLLWWRYRLIAFLFMLLMFVFIRLISKKYPTPIGSSLPVANG